jgi:predicted CoA-binding protein
MAEQDVIREIFKKYQTIAVCGMSRDPDKPAHYVPAYLQRQGYNIIPINPYADVILGRRSYPTVHEVPDTIDILEVFRPSDQALEVVKQAIGRRKEKGDVAVIWLQQGIRNETAKRVAEEAGITFIQDRCMYVDHKRLFSEGRRML